MIVRQFLMICGVVICGVSAVSAQDNMLYFSPELVAEFTAPTAFEGLYVGVVTGAISVRKNNFNVGGADIRPEIGGVVGWNQPIGSGVVLGGEVQATVATDFAGSNYVRAMAIARLGFAAGDNSLVYVLGGVGYLGTSTAFEAGIGAEVMVTDSLGLRAEAAGIGQIGPVPNGNNVPAISAMRITGAAIWQLDGPPASTVYNSGPVTEFSGAYAGLNIGGLTDQNFNFFENYGWGWHLSRFEMGGLAGYNYALNDTFRVGVEAQLGVNFDTSGDAGLDMLALARVGAVPMTGLLAYAAGGVGLVEGKGAYVVGGGVEYALWGQTSLRGEALLLGRLDGGPGLTGIAGPVSSKVTVGTVWHFD